MLSLPRASDIIQRTKIDLDLVNFILYIYLISLFYCSYEVLLTLDKEKHPVDGPICYYLFNTLLFCLLVLHIYWFVLMYRMLVKQIQARGKLSEDVRSGKYSIFFVAWKMTACKDTDELYKVINQSR